MGYFASSVDVPMDRTIANAAAAGRMYTVASGNIAITSGGAYAAISLFWTARATKIIVISAMAQNANASNAHRLSRTTTDPALSGFSISGLAIRSMLQGQAASSVNLTSATEAVAGSTGNIYRAGYNPTSAGVPGSEFLLKPSDYIVIPPNVAGGIILLMNGASTNGVAGEITWLEI